VERGEWSVESEEWRVKSGANQGFRGFIRIWGASLEIVFRIII
jgi:hypothetical protein